MAAVEDNKQTVQDEHTGTDEHGEDEFLSRKALQRYMHTTKVMQEQGKTQQDDRTEDESNKTKSKGADPAAVSGPAASGNGAEKVGNKGDNHDEQDFEHILRLDSAGDAEGDEKLLSKLVDEAKSKEDEGEEVERNVVEVLEDDEDEDDDMVTATRNGLLESLNTDVEKYHKKVQLKKKFDNSALVMEKKISHDLGRAQQQLEGDSSRKRGRDGKDADLERAGGEDNENDDESGEGEGGAYKKNKSLAAGRKVSSWTKVEDDAIVYYKEEMKYSWKKIEELLEKKHSWQAIQMRYLRNHKSRNDEWSRYMEIKLINAIRKDWENRWKRISADLGKEFGTERCTTKNIEICKKMELPYYKSVFKNKEITTGYKNQFNDIKDAEAHKKLMLVYMGLDSITYEDSDNEDKGGASLEQSEDHENDSANADAKTNADANSTSEASKTDMNMNMNMNMNMSMMGMNMGMNIDDDVHVAEIDTANVDPAITGESISKDGGSQANIA